MPLYEYHCPTCQNKFEKLQPMSATGADCPNCEQPAKRAISVFARVSSGAPEPMDLGTMPSTGGFAGAGGCGSACGCGH